MPKDHSCINSTNSASPRTRTSVASSVSAVAGSLSPLPVSTHTHFALRGTCPSRTARRSAATPAADAGSQNTPARRGILRYASRICESLSARKLPLESWTTAIPGSHVAGRAMGIAVAIEMVEVQFQRQ